MLKILALVLLVPLLVANGSPLPGMTTALWSGKIVFQSNRNGKTRLWVLTPDGNATLIPNQPGGGKTSGPAWDESGTRIAFYQGKAGDHDIYVINEDGTGLENVTSSPGVDDRGPSWIFDPGISGNPSIIWASDMEGGAPKIFAMALADKIPVRCDEDIPGRNTRPVINRQGTRITYNSNELVGGAKDKMMVADFSWDPLARACSISNRQAPFAKGHEWRPNWHPNGTVLTVAHTENGDPCVLGKEVYTINQDGSGQTRLTCEPDQQYAPVFSPQDGMQIVYTTAETGDQELFLMNADGSGKTNLTNFPSANDSQPDWWQPTAAVRP